MQVYTTLINTNFMKNVLNHQKQVLRGRESIFKIFQNIYLILAFYQKYVYVTNNDAIKGFSGYFP